MSDFSTLLPWLLLGGLFVVCGGLGVALYALWGVARKLAEHSDKLNALARSGANHSERLAKLSPAPDLHAIGELLRDEWQVFQAIYRADLATTLSEVKLSEAKAPVKMAPPADDSLERAIGMARAGRSVQMIMAECGIGRIDAEALVHFHKPQQSLAG